MNSVDLRVKTIKHNRKIVYFLTLFLLSASVILIICNARVSQLENEQKAPKIDLDNAFFCKDAGTGTVILLFDVNKSWYNTEELHEICKEFLLEGGK